MLYCTDLVGNLVSCLNLHLYVLLSFLGGKPQVSDKRWRHVLLLSFEIDI